MKVDCVQLRWMDSAKLWNPKAFQDPNNTNNYSGHFHYGTTHSAIVHTKIPSKCTASPQILSCLWYTTLVCMSKNLGLPRGTSSSATLPVHVFLFTKYANVGKLCSYPLPSSAWGWEVQKVFIKLWTIYRCLWIK